MTALVLYGWTDNGGEFLNTKLHNLISSKGIEHQLIMPYHPHQDDIAERIYHTVQNKARTMLKAVFMPIHHKWHGFYP